MTNFLYNKSCIVAHGYMMPDGSRRSLGGIQTYVDALIRLLQPLSNTLSVIQPAEVPFNVRDQYGQEIIGIPGYGREVGRYYRRHLAGKCDITICTHLRWAHWCSGPRLIAIDHGIGWDGAPPRKHSLIFLLKKHYAHNSLWRYRRYLREVMPRIEKLICTDLNFPNWLRATFPRQDWKQKISYIPNFGDPFGEEEIKAKLSRATDQLTVLIPRRFEIMRGFPMITQIVNDIYDDWPDVSFIFAGWGTQKKRMREILKGRDRCKIVRLPPEEIRQAYFEAEIVVIPTIWSESTSLACIEGMCSGAAVLVTAIGGLGNVVLPDYNGLMVSPTYEGIRTGLETLLGDTALRQELAKAGYETAKKSFSREMWEKRVMRVLLDLQ